MNIPMLESLHPRSDTYSSLHTLVQAYRDAVTHVPNELNKR